jgi:hypothetical protein
MVLEVTDKNIAEILSEKEVTVLQFSDDSTILFINNHDNFYFYNTLNGQL